MDACDRATTTHSLIDEKKTHTSQLLMDGCVIVGTHEENINTEVDTSAIEDSESRTWAIYAVFFQSRFK